MTIPADTSALLRKVASISLFELTADEKNAVASLPIQLASLDALQDVVHEGDRPSRSFVLLDGFMAAFKVTKEGKRQVLAFYVPGDLPDLHSLHLQVLDNGFVTLTRCRVGFVAHDSLHELCKAYPRLTHVLWRSTLIDGAIFREWLLNIGQREAYACIAHLLCEMMVRLDAVGRVTDHTCALPITQVAIADAMGMTSVHVSRTMKLLRSNGLITWKGGTLTVHDWGGLTRAAGFNATYLHLRLDLNVLRSVCPQ